jgi:hypothetical protein
MKTSVAILLPLTLLVIVGCHTTPNATDVRTQARSGYGLMTRRPNVERTADGLFVSGSVGRGAFYSGSARMHLDLQVFSESGQRLALVPTTFIPNPIPHSPRIPGHACYAQRVRGDFPSGVLVVVEPHPVSLRECANRPGEHL